MKRFFNTVNYSKYPKIYLKCNYSTTTITDKQIILSHINTKNRKFVHKLIQTKSQSHKDLVDDYNRRWKKKISVNDFYDNFIPDNKYLDNLINKTKL